MTTKHFLLLLRKRKGEKEEVECCWMERRQGEKDSRVQLMCVDRERALVLQRTESVLHVLQQLRVIGFNLRLALLHGVLRETECNDKCN